MGALNKRVGGVFSSMPGASPKYAQNSSGGLSTDFKGTMARMFLWLSSEAADNLKTYVRSAHDTRLEKLVEKLIATPEQPNKGYIEFLLQQANHNVQDKVVVVDTLADVYAAYTFGASPATFSYTVVWLNNQQDDQAANMYRLYWHVLRTVKMAGIQSEVHLQYDNMRVSGLITHLSWSLQATDESYCPGQFTMLVRNIELLSAPQFIVEEGDVYDNDGAVNNVVTGVAVQFVNPASAEGLGDPEDATPPTRALVVTPPPVAAPGASAAALR